MPEPARDLPRVGAPARRALAQAGCTQLGQPAGGPAAELSRLHGMGPRALGLLREALAERELTRRAAGGGRRATRVAAAPLG